MFTEDLEKIRKSLGMKQPEVAEMIDITDRQYRDYLNGVSCMPFKSKVRLVNRIKHPALALSLLAEIETPFSPANLRVDSHPAMEFVRSVQEITEALKAMEEVDICNPDTRKVKRALDQMLDLMHLIPQVAISWCEAYRVDLWEVRANNIKKLEAKGYLAGEDQ